MREVSAVPYRGRAFVAVAIALASVLIVGLASGSAAGVRAPNVVREKAVLAFAPAASSVPRKHLVIGSMLPNWSPDGTRIVFQSNRAGNYEIYVMNADGGRQTRLTWDGTNRQARYRDRDEAPAWSPDGTKIAFASQVARDGIYSSEQIYVMGADGGRQRRLTTTLGDSTFAHSPAWSPDGQQIAFAREIGDIFVIKADGTGQRRVTSGPDVDAAPDWSPDGKLIAVNGGEDDKGYIDVIAVDTGRRTRLTESGQDYSPDWSPDGRRIAFTSYRDSNAQLYVMDADGTGEVRLVRGPVRRSRTHPGRDYAPRWAPDGLKIAFMSNRAGDSTEIHVMNADGTNPRQLTKPVRPL